MEKYTYRIVGKCPFGTQVVDSNGMMDDSQFLDGDARDYPGNCTGANLAILTAQQYGAKPVCVIETDFCKIDVYKISTQFGIIVHYNSGVYHVCDIAFHNIIGPAALVNYAESVNPGQITLRPYSV